MNTKKYLKLLSVSKTSGGFTLIELLVAIAMSGILVTVMGAGMMAILNSSKTSTSKANIKNQLNRAVDYINDDIKKARIAGISTTNNTNDTVVLTYFESLNSFSTPHTIKYYLDVASNPWLGPNVLRRQVDNGNWQVVVDGLTENTIDATDFTCAGTATALTLGGFQACVEQATASNGSPLYRTTVALFGEISDTDGSNANSETLRVGTDTISRSVTPTLDPPVITFENQTDTTPDLQWTAIQGASSYDIYSCTTPDAINDCEPTAPPAPKPVIGTTLTGTIETPGSRTCYRGKSVNGAVTSEYGDTICTIVASTVAPTEVSGLVASDVVQPVVTWLRDPAATEYDLYRCETSDPTTPCTISVGTDTPVETFTAITDVAFEDKVPWSESLNTGLMPADNKAFCYGVVAKNTSGSSSISNIDCGIANAPLGVESGWDVEFVSFDTTAIQPENVTWSDNAAFVATSYEIRRCEADGNLGLTTCDPEGAGNVVFDGLISPTDYDETTAPEPTNTFCYTVRAKNLTTSSPFSIPICAETRPDECDLNMAALGQGSTLSYESSATDGERSTLELVVKGPFDNAPITQNVAKTGLGNVLHTIEENSTGSYISAYKAKDIVTLPCDTQIRFSWHYPDTSLVAPTLSASSSSKPTLSWTDPNSPQGFYYAISRCQTSNAECTPPDSFIETLNGFSWSQTGQPSNGNRFCYKIKAFFADGLESDYSNVACGDPK